MTLTGRFLSIFPAIHFLAVVASLIFAISDPKWWSIVLIPFLVYLLPPLCFRFFNLFFKLKTGYSDISANQVNPWWCSHQFQLLYITFPFIENILKFIPGFYSAWLRLWGAKIGKNVYWTLGTKIYDRPLLNVGKNVVFGDQTHMVGHIVAPKRGKMGLYVKEVKVGDDTSIGARTGLGPGAIIDDFIKLPHGREVKVNEHITQTEL